MWKWYTTSDRKAINLRSREILDLGFILTFSQFRDSLLYFLFSLYVKDHFVRLDDGAKKNNESNILNDTYLLVAYSFYDN